MNEVELLAALMKGGPWGVAILALGFALQRYILPLLKELKSIDRERDAAWQASLREIGVSHKEATATAVGGFKDALDRHDKAMDRYAVQHQSLAADVGQVKSDVASMRSDLHSVVTRLTTLDGMPSLKKPE